MVSKPWYLECSGLGRLLYGHVKQNLFLTQTTLYCHHSHLCFRSQNILCSLARTLYITCWCHAVLLVLLEADAGAEDAAKEAMRLDNASGCWWLLLLLVLLMVVVLVALLPTPPPAPRLSVEVCCCCSSTIVRRPAESACGSLLLSSARWGRARPSG